MVCCNATTTTPKVQKKHENIPTFLYGQFSSFNYCCKLPYFLPVLSFTFLHSDRIKYVVRVLKTRLCWPSWKQENLFIYNILHLLFLLQVHISFDKVHILNNFFCKKKGFSTCVINYRFVKYFVSEQFANSRVFINPNWIIIAYVFYVVTRGI